MDIPDFSRAPVVRYKPATQGVILADLIATFVNGGSYNEMFDLFIQVEENDKFVAFVNIYCFINAKGNFTQMETVVLDKTTLELVWHIDNDFIHMGDRLDDLPVWTLPELRKIAESENDYYPGYRWDGISWKDFV